MNSGCECTSGAGGLDDWAGFPHGLMTGPGRFKNITLGDTSEAAIYLIPILKNYSKSRLEVRPHYKTQYHSPCVTSA